MQGDNKIILAVVPADVDDLQGAAKSLNEARRADPDGTRTIGKPSVLATSWACLLELAQLDNAFAGVLTKFDIAVSKATQQGRQYVFENTPWYVDPGGLLELAS